MYNSKNKLKTVLGLIVIIIGFCCNLLVATPGTTAFQCENDVCTQEEDTGEYICEPAKQPAEAGQNCDIQDAGNDCEESECEQL